MGFQLVPTSVTWTTSLYSALFHRIRLLCTCRPILRHSGWRSRLVMSARTFILVFWEEEWLVGATPSTGNFGSTHPHWSEIADFQPIIARSASAVTPSERSSINANRKFTTRFPMSLRWSPYVTPKFPKGNLGELKNAKRPIFIKNALRLKKVCYKVSLCENCQRQSCKAFIGLTNCAKIIGGGWPLVPKIFD